LKGTVARASPTSGDVVGGWHSASVTQHRRDMAKQRFTGPQG
jgi:hypothetical protein